MSQSQNANRENILTDEDRLSAFMLSNRFQRFRINLARTYARKRAKYAQAEGFSEHPDDWLARCIYRELKELADKGDIRILDYVTSQQRSLTAGRNSIAGQPFKLGLVLLLCDELTYNRSRRGELANAMEYAHLHGVPSRYFNGFVKQAVQKKIAKKLQDGHTEPGFKRRLATLAPS